MTFPSLRKTTALLLCAAAAGGVAACGDSDAEKLTETVQQQSEQLQDRAVAAQRQAREIADKIRSGELTPEEGQRQLEELGGGIADEAADLAKDSIDQAKELDGVPDDVKDQLDEAKGQLDEMQQQTP